MTSYDHDRRVWSGPRQPCVFNPACNFGQIVLNLLERSAEKVIQIDGDTGRTMTRSEMRLRVVRVAQNLQKLGYGVGDIASVVAVNSENLAPLILGLQVIGVGFNALAPTFDEEEMAHMMRQTQSKLVFCDANNYGTVKAAAEKAIISEQFRIFVMEDAHDETLSVDQLLKPTGTEHVFYPRYLGDSYKLIANITCSSGTMGLPKGVCFSHAQTISGFCKVANFDDGICLNFSTLYWGTGVYVLNMSVMNNSTRLITRRTFSVDLFFELIQKYKIKFFYTPASYAAAIIADPRVRKTDMSSIKFWALGASSVSETIRDAVDDVLKPTGRSYNFYGTSECGFLAADFLKRKPNAVGKVGTNMQVRILSDDGEPLGVGEQGEVVVKSVGIPFIGYYKNEQASREALDKDGWFLTGDIGFFDEEGYLHLVERKKDILKYMGNQVSPSEVEAVIQQIHEVLQVCVTGIPNKDNTSDLVTAVIRKYPKSDLSAEDVIEYVANRLSDPKHLRGGVYFVNEFPMTTNGKIIRRKVRQMLQEGEIQ
ncbi:probable 4-coumarate--CoA ligase 1 [Topomyia yanbarensis]|uniref:probable 4-coumarate--CoA ligase 1 n=1 Tax=Topomyia yanbarensis TaxID=2498891 RepID=UPI00273C3EF2|nr:probable 4-coumarate--CoA ligase 1 [Topomyia yanbarensis]